MFHCILVRQTEEDRAILTDDMQEWRVMFLNQCTSFGKILIASSLYPSIVLL